MASVSQFKLQIDTNVKYTGGEAVLPQPPLPAPPRPLVIPQGVQPDGTDYGAIKVEDGKLIIDMADFNPDFGRF
jgi:hypothetical protein